MTGTLVPVRLTEAHALHLGQATGRGYQAVCGRFIAGEDVQIPMPRFPRSRRHVEAYWGRCWEHELVCRTCDKRSEKMQ